MTEELIVDVDAITSDNFLDLMELAERWQGAGADAAPSHKDLRRMLDILRPAVTNMDIGTLPFRQLMSGEIINRVIAGTIEAAGPNLETGSDDISG